MNNVNNSFFDNPLVELVKKDTLIGDGFQAVLKSHTANDIDTPPLSHHLVMMNTGSPIHLYRNHDGKAVEGLYPSESVLVLPAGFSSRYRWQETASVFYLYLERDFVEQIRDSIAIPSQAEELRPDFGFNDPQTIPLLRLLMREVENGEPSGRLFTTSLITAYTVYLLQQHGTSSGRLSNLSGKIGNTELRCAIDYINDHLYSDLSAQEIADIAGYSVHHFQKLFKAATRKPLHQFVIERRVERAKELLLQKNALISRIANEVGFADHAHLTRHFKRLVGVSPRQFRDSCR